MYKMWRLNIHSTRARKHLHLYMYIVRVMNLCRFINLLEPVRACNDQIINYLLFIKILLFAHICFPLSDYFVHRSLLFRKCSCELSLCQPATQCNKKKKKKKNVNLRFASSPTFASPNLASLTFASPTFALPNEQSHRFCVGIIFLCGMRGGIICIHGGICGGIISIHGGIRGGIICIHGGIRGGIVFVDAYKSLRHRLNIINNGELIVVIRIILHIPV